MGPAKSVKLAYGRSGLTVELPASADVIEPRYPPPIADEVEAMRAALRQPIGSRPLGELVRRGARVGIVVCDVTRAFPSRRIIPVLLDELDTTHVTLFIATGTHRLCTPAELQQMLGPDLPRRCEVVQHDAFDRARHTQLGTVPGTDVPALVETAFLEQDVRITTGFIEPHFFAGFSGGPKMVSPGLAALETVLDLHSAVRVGDPRATWGVIDGNPIHDAVRAIAARANVTFNLDVTLDAAHRVTSVFAGELFASHRAGCAFARETAMAPVRMPYDVVVSTNSGYPLDQNLYQTVKGMSAAAQIVRQGGHIVMASECADGLPDHGRYKDLLRVADGPDSFLAHLREPGFTAHDQWQVQVQSLIQKKADVRIKAGGLTGAQLRAAWFEPIVDVSACVSALMDELGDDARVAVLPQGPQTIPYLVAGD
jgi:nickel-dependent lactate racemase